MAQITRSHFSRLINATVTQLDDNHDNLGSDNSNSNRTTERHTPASALWRRDTKDTHFYISLLADRERVPMSLAAYETQYNSLESRESLGIYALAPLYSDSRKRWPEVTSAQLAQDAILTAWFSLLIWRHAATCRRTTGLPLGSYD